MSNLLMPARRILAEPEIIEGYGTPEFFVSGGVVREATAECVRVLVYIERRHGETVEYHEVLSLHMPRTGYELSLARAWTSWKGGGAAH